MSSGSDSLTHFKSVWFLGELVPLPYMALPMSALSTQREYFWTLSSAVTIFQPTVTVYISSGCCFHAFIPDWLTFYAKSWTLDASAALISCFFKNPVWFTTEFKLTAQGTSSSCIWCGRDPQRATPARQNQSTALCTDHRKNGGYSGSCSKKHVITFGCHVFAKHLICGTRELLLPVNFATFYFLKCSDAWYNNRKRPPNYAPQDISFIV